MNYKLMNQDYFCGRTIFILNIHPRVDEIVLRGHFKEFGHIEEINLFNKNNYVSKNKNTFKTALIRYRYEREAVTALKARDCTKFFGWEFSITQKVPKRVSKNFGKIYILNVNETLRLKDLKRYFNSQSKVYTCRFERKFNGELTGKGFMSFENRHEAIKVYHKLNGKRIFGMILKLSINRSYGVDKMDNQSIHMYSDNHSSNTLKSFNRSKNKVGLLRAKAVRQEDTYGFLIHSIYVKRIDANISKATLKGLFEKYGEIEKIELRNEENDDDTKCSVIRYSHPNGAFSALSNYKMDKELELITKKHIMHGTFVEILTVQIEKEFIKLKQHLTEKEENERYFNEVKGDFESLKEMEKINDTPIPVSIFESMDNSMESESDMLNRNISLSSLSDSSDDNSIDLIEIESNRSRLKTANKTKDAVTRKFGVSPKAHSSNLPTNPFTLPEIAQNDSINVLNQSSIYKKTVEYSLDCNSIVESLEANW